MQSDPLKLKSMCSICSRPLTEDADPLLCCSCSSKIHPQCLLDIFPSVSTQLHPKDPSNQSKWECFICQSLKSSVEEPKCMFCEETSGFLVRVELKPAEFIETAKTHWGHLSCIEQRKTCEKKPETCTFFYTNTLNHIRRGKCMKCKKFLNLECKNCQKYFLHHPCPANKGQLKVSQDYCSKCLVFLKKKKTLSPSVEHRKEDKRRPPKEEKKVSQSEPKPLKSEPKPLKSEPKPLKSEPKPLITPKATECSPDDVKIEPQPQTLTESASNPNDDYGDDKDSPKDIRDEEDLIPEHENKKSKSASHSLNAIYKTRAPDLLIELLINLMKFDKLQLLRASSIGVDFEKTEAFAKNQDKYADLVFHFKPETLLNYNDMNQKYLIFDTNISEFELMTPTNPMKVSQKYTNIDLLHDKATKNTYFSYKEFERDLFKVFNTVLQTRCFSQTSRNYLTTLLDYYLKNIKSKKFPSLFFAVKSHDIETIVSQETLYKLPCSNWPVIPKSFRHYVSIDSYIPIEQNHDVKKDLKAYKSTVKCPENCACWEFDALGDFSYELSTWLSKCPNRAQKIECDKNAHDGVCKNMGIGMKQRKILGIDVEETLSWGIDIYTRKNIFMVLPENKDELEAKFEFIQNKLMKAINLQKTQGYDMRSACNFILQKTKKGSDDLMFEKRDRDYAKIILKALDMNQDPEAFRIHSKGQGLICINKNGFRKNEFIVEYFGEIYSPCYWYEKQDQIKKYLKEKNKRNVLLDFYNIMLEIHKNDPKGYNIFFVDPIHKGNYSSRLSHSCDPNCGTVTTIVDGQYVIGMYAMKDINYGEELTFDYCSVTEDFNELKKAFCLCGSKKCRGKYLELIKTKESNTFIEHVHGFLERNKIILRSSIEPFTPQDQAILDKFDLKDRILEDSPEWLKKWLAFTLDFVEKEKVNTRESLDEKIPTGLTPEEEKRQKDVNEYCANSHKESRIQNLVITCNKVKYFLQKSKSYDPPFMLLNHFEIYELLWGKPEKVPIPIDAKDTTVINDVLKSLYSNLETPEAVKCIHLIHLMDEDIQKLIKTDPPRTISLIRLAFLMLSMMLKDPTTTASTNSTQSLHRNAMADMCYFYAFTHTYFKTGEYLPSQGDNVYVRRCDVSNVETYIQEALNLGVDGEIVSQGAKSYKGTMLWGQLVGWFKQTVVNPEASLSQDRRGTLSNPVFSGSFVHVSLDYPFQKKTEPVLEARIDFLSHIKRKPSYSWPPQAAKWSYKNPQKIYGTLLFENQVLSEKIPNYMSTVLDAIDLEPEKQLDLLDRTEQMIEGLNGNNFLQFYENYQAGIKDLKSSDLTIFSQKFGSEKRKRNSNTSNLIKNLKNEEDDEPKTPKLAKKKKITKNKESKVDSTMENNTNGKQEEMNGEDSPQIDQYKIKHNTQKIQIEKNGKEEEHN